MVFYWIKSILPFFYIFLLISCKPISQNLGNELELLRIKTLKNADAYENIIEFHQSFDLWNNIENKNKADSFFLKLSQDYQIPLTEEVDTQEISLFSQDSFYLEIENPLMKNQKIEIPFINFHNQDQEIDVQSSLIYFKKFDLQDFQRKKKQIIGKTLVLELNENQFKEYIEHSKSSGILGLIIIMKEGNSVPCYQYLGDYKIPILGLSQDDGFFLIESLKKYPNQFIRIFIKQNIKKQKNKIWKWEKNYGKSQNIYVLCSWKPNICNNAILSHVTPSFILLDVAKIFQNLEWNSRYNLIFLWSDGNFSHFTKNLKDIYINLDSLTDFIGWKYSIKDKTHWNFVEKHLKVYENHLEMKSQNNHFSNPIIPLEHQKIINTDLENVEWIHKDMILHSLGMLALTLYLLSVS